MVSPYMTNPFAGLQQGMQVAGGLIDMYNAPKDRAFSMEQARQEMALRQGQLGVQQGQLAQGAQQLEQGQQRIDLAERAQDEETRRYMAETLSALAGIALPHLKSGDEEKANKAFSAIEAITGKPIPPEMRTLEAVEGIYNARVGATDRQKLQVQVDKLKLERQKELNDQRKEELDREIREKELQLSREKEQRMASKLSATAEKALIESQDSYRSFVESASQFRLLADDYERVDPDSGALASFGEFAKTVLGSQDEATELRRRFNKVRISEGVSNLPPGPATDKDVELALKGVPAEFTNKDQATSFLRGASRLANISAAYNQFKSKYISEKGNTRGLIGKWKEEVTIPQDVGNVKAGEKISIAEIYEASVKYGKPVAEIMRGLGLSQELGVE